MVSILYGVTWSALSRPPNLVDLLVTVETTTGERYVMIAWREPYGNWYDTRGVVLGDALEYPDGEHVVAWAELPVIEPYEGKP